MRLRFGIALLSCTLAVAAACSSADPVPAGGGDTNEGTSEAGLSETRQGELGINPCAVVLCPTNTSCEVVDGDAACVPFATSCAAVLCLEGTECIEQDGRAECVPQGPTSCAAVTCLVGDECVERDGRAECVPSAASCAAVLCLEGTVCEERDGRAQCVPAENICNLTDCATGLICEVRDGEAVCVPPPGGITCASVLCIEGTVCEERDGRAECVPFENPCNLTDCATGLICELQNGEAVCVPPPGGITCASVLCIVGTVCEETPTGPQCLPSGDFCGGFAGIPCGSGEECIDDPSDDCDPENGGADCGGVCVEQPVTDPCAAVRCRAGTHCEATDGVAECVSDRTCDKH
jgi:hypothetical protein